MKNGCEEDIPVDSLETHEKSCLYRNILCPSLTCQMTNIIFKDILLHYQEKHSNVVPFEKVLAIKGPIESLNEATYIINAYERIFLPQFHFRNHS